MTLNVDMVKVHDQFTLTPVKHGTRIGWTHWPNTRGETLVTVTGCTPVSPGCDHCYSAVASSMPRLNRLEKYQGVAENGAFTGLIKVHPKVLEDAARWDLRRTIFYNSMGDTLHKDVSVRFIARGFAMAAGTTRHNWLKLTKRHARLRALMRSGHFRDLILAEYRDLFGPSAPLFEWPLPNVAVGVSVENQDLADRRMPYLMDCAEEAACLFVSAEPLVGAVDLNPWLDRQRFAGQLWVIAGGESGPRRRPLDLDHVRDLRDACSDAHVPFYFKQVGGLTPNAGGRLLDGVTHDGFPAMAYRTVTGPKLRLAA